MIREIPVAHAYRIVTDGHIAWLVRPDGTPAGVTGLPALSAAHIDHVAAHFCRVVAVEIDGKAT